MNRGDFGHTHMPKTFRVVAPGQFQVTNSSGFALGTFAGAVPAALNIAFPADVMDQLKAEGLVTATTIDLYNTALDPLSSPANLSRYLSLMQRLAPSDVSDTP
ncbi:MAG TPA: hypothetical protein VLK83_13930 [Rhodanobacteraceae bacterium]|nr:hypothetical protein [Rhodanobacteraceae bacterium]